MSAATSSDVDGSSVNERGRKRLRGRAWRMRGHGGSRSGSSESPTSRRSKRSRRTRLANRKSVPSVSSHSTDSTSESSNSESDNDGEESAGDDSGSIDLKYCTGVRIPRASRFLPTFTGEGEKWKVWFARFEDVVEAHRWTTAERLSALIPLLRKEAGEFVFGLVSRRVRTNYKRLVRELRMRYRTVESKRGYKLQWAELKQTPSQSVEELAARIKVLYDKAFPNLDQRTRKEDMVSKFFEVLTDTSAKAQVQFIKNPKNIDDAVKYVVRYAETYKSRKGDVRARATKTEEGLEEDEHDDGMARAVNSQPPMKKSKADSSKSGQAQGKDSQARRPNDSKNGNGKGPRSDKCYKCDGVGHMR